MSTTAVTPPASAPATETVETPEVSLQERLNAATPEEYTHWEKTGDIPAIKPPKAAASEAAPISEVKPAADGSAPSKEDPAVASAPPAASQKKHREKTREDTERRFRELLDDNKSLKTRLEEIERRAAPATATSDKPASQPAAKADSATVTRAEPKIDDIDPATGKPKYTKYEDYLADVRKWDREQVLAELKGETSKTEEARVKQEQERTRAEQQRILGEGLNRKFDVSRKKYADFDAVALNPDLVIPAGSVTDAFLLDSEHAGEVAYYLGQHPEVLDGFYSDFDQKTGKFTNKINPMRQHRQLLDIEREVSAPGTAPKIPPAPHKPLPPPPTVLSAKSSAEGDPVEEAIKKKSFADYEKAANARERKERRS